MKTLGLLKLLVVCCVFMIGQDAFAQKSMTVVFTPWFPYTYTENGEAKGYEIEILKAVFPRMHVDAEYVELPWKRCLMRLENGEADALSSMLRTPEREAYALLPDTQISCSRVVLFTRKDARIDFDGSYESLKDKKLGFVLGFDYGEEFDQARFLQKDLGISIQYIIKKVVEGHNDVGIENELVIKASAKKLGVSDQIKILSPAVFTKSLFIGFSKKTTPPDFVAAFSAELKEFQNSPEYREITDRYGIVCP